MLLLLLFNWTNTDVFNTNYCVRSHKSFWLSSKFHRFPTIIFPEYLLPNIFILIKMEEQWA